MNLQELKARLIKNQSDYWVRRNEFITLRVAACRYAYGVGFDEWTVRRQAAEKYESVLKP